MVLNTKTQPQQVVNTWCPFYKHGLTLIPAWISNYIHYKVWDEITSYYHSYTELRNRWSLGMDK